MPADDGVRLDQDESRAPTGVQLGQANPEQPVAATQWWSRPLPAQHRQLLAERQVLQDELAAWQQEQTEETSDGAEQFHALER